MPTPCKYALTLVRAAIVTAVSAAPLAVKPDPLLAIDQNRMIVVNRVVETWAESLARSMAGLTREQLREMLAALRADLLMAASLAGSLEGVRDVLARSMVGESSVATGRVRGKAHGDPNADLTYTPVVPCPILDTRIINGALQPDVARIFEGYVPNFAVRGGASSDCGIPASVPVLALNVYAVNPTNMGFIKVWAFGTAEPAVSTVNSQVGITAIASSTLVPVVWISAPPRLGQVDAGRKLHRGTQSRHAPPIPARCSGWNRNRGLPRPASLGVHGC